MNKIFIITILLQNIEKTLPSRGEALLRPVRWNKALLKKFKTIVISVLLITLCYHSCYGEQNKNFSDKFKEGNLLYEKGDYKGAEKIYEDLIKSGVTGVYYNAGNAAFKAGFTGKAILYYERALLMSPRDEDIKQNLRYVRSLTVDKQVDENNGIFSFLFSGLNGYLSLNELTVIVLIFYFLLFLGGLLYIFVDQSRVRLFLKITGIFIFFFFFCSSLFLFIRIYDREYVKKGIVMTYAEKGRSGPGEDYTEVFTIHEGSRVFLRDTLQDWRKITLPNGYSGWVKNKSLEEI